MRREGGSGRLSCILGRVHMYSDLAPWFHLLTHPSDYADEAAFVRRVVDDVAIGETPTLLELGSGGGNNASHLKARFQCTLTDVSPEMLALSRTLNPECEHLEGDMRTLRLGRTFDVVLRPRRDLVPDDRGRPRAPPSRQPRLHVRPGGVVILTPDATTEIFNPQTDHGGHDGEDGRSLRYLEWTHAATGSTYDVDYLIIARGPGEDAPRRPRSPRARALSRARLGSGWCRRQGSSSSTRRSTNPYELEHAAFVGRRPTT